MNHPSPLKISGLALLFGLLIAFSGLQAQRNQLVLINHSNEKVIHVKYFQEVFLNLTDGQTQIHGLLREVKDSSMVVGDDEILFEDISAINNLSLTNWLAMGVGAGLIGTGYIWSTVGALFFSQGVVNADPLFLLGGMLDMGIGAAISTVGGLPFIKRSRRYTMKGGWELKTLKHEQEGV